MDISVCVQRRWVLIHTILVVAVVVIIVAPTIDAKRKSMKQAPTACTTIAVTPITTTIANLVHRCGDVILVVVVIYEFDHVNGEKFLGDPNDDARDQHDTDQSHKDIGSVLDRQNRRVAIELYQCIAGIVEFDCNRKVGPNNDQGNDEVRTRRLSRQKKGARWQEHTECDNVGPQLGSGALRESVAKYHGKLHDRADQQPTTMQIKGKPKQPVLEQGFGSLPLNSRRRRQESHHRHDSPPSRSISVNGWDTQTVVVLTGQQKHQT
mmetsp:Transcript_17425/g.36429  ORF Transcript_17425/g.36429 Transcript_17425/m.36429 type:complete len:265 (-) Transcript_17425:520-1314(-)